MSDPIYGDRRCPKCMSVRASQLDPCWYCERKMPTEDDVATAIAETIRKEVDGNILEELVRAVTDPAPLPIIADPLMPPDTLRIEQGEKSVTVDLSDFPISGLDVSRATMDSVALSVRALQSHDIHGDAYKLAKWLKAALKEIDDLRAENVRVNADRDRLLARIDDLHQTDPGC